MRTIRLKYCQKKFDSNMDIMVLDYVIDAFGNIDELLKLPTGTKREFCDLDPQIIVKKSSNSSRSIISMSIEGEGKQTTVSYEPF